MDGANPVWSFVCVTVLGERACARLHLSALRLIGVFLICFFSARFLLSFTCSSVCFFSFSFFHSFFVLDPLRAALRLCWLPGRCPRARAEPHVRFCLRRQGMNACRPASLLLPSILLFICIHLFVLLLLLLQGDDVANELMNLMKASKTYSTPAPPTSEVSIQKQEDEGEEGERGGGE